eukprot:gene13133-27910_t
MQRDFLPMVNEMDAMNRPGGVEVGEAEWDDFDVTWCVPDLNGELHDLVPGGKDIKVRLSEKERYCRLAREKLKALAGAPPKRKKR